MALVFVSGVNDSRSAPSTTRRSLDAAETRAIYFDLDPEGRTGSRQEWFDARLGIPLDIVEAPFRDLTGPMLEEVRRFTARPARWST